MMELFFPLFSLKREPFLSDIKERYTVFRIQMRRVLSEYCSTVPAYLLHTSIQTKRYKKLLLRLIVRIFLYSSNLNVFMHYFQTRLLTSIRLLGKTARHRAVFFKFQCSFRQGIVFHDIEAIRNKFVTFVFSRSKLLFLIIIYTKLSVYNVLYISKHIL